jgi:hypothetical protein
MTKIWHKKQLCPNFCLNPGYSLAWNTHESDVRKGMEAIVSVGFFTG